MRWYRSVFVLVAVLAIGACGLGQTSLPKDHVITRSGWKEYVYPEAGFAITSPRAPVVNKDLIDSISYSVYLRHDTFVHVDVGKKPTNCTQWFNEVTDLLNANGADKSPLGTRVVYKSKLTTVRGYPAVVFQYPRRETHRVEYHCNQCLNGKRYTWWAAWPMGQLEPAALARIINSFRLLTTGPKR